jgi:hypothetical protein
MISGDNRLFGEMSPLATLLGSLNFSKGLLSGPKKCQHRYLVNILYYNRPVFGWKLGKMRAQRGGIKKIIFLAAL